jgi:hypothetical protein
LSSHFNQQGPLRMAQDPQMPDIRLDSKALYREESFTDRRVGTLRRLVPVDAQGRDDSSRPVIYEGQASLMTPGGSLPLHFQIDADSMEDALSKFPDVAQLALEQTVEELRRMQREAQSSILVPGSGGGSGGMPGGGRIKL